MRAESPRSGCRSRPHWLERSHMLLRSWHSCGGLERVAFGGAESWDRVDSKDCLVIYGCGSQSHHSNSFALLSVLVLVSPLEFSS